MSNTILAQSDIELIEQYKSCWTTHMSNLEFPRNAGSWKRKAEEHASELRGRGYYVGNGMVTRRPKRHWTW